MKRIRRIKNWVGLTAVIGLLCAMSPGGQRDTNTKPFKETGREYFVTRVLPGSFEHPFFTKAREQEEHTEDWAGVVLQTSQNNVGGQGSGLAMEAVFADQDGSITVYAMKYEVVANGDQLAMAGWFRPQGDGTFVGELEFLPDECTGRFAGATGTLPNLKAIPGPGYIFEGTITTVGASMK